MRYGMISDYQRHVDYIHYNPVKHKYVIAVKDWPISSFHGFVKLGIDPIDWGGSELQDMELEGME